MNKKKVPSIFAQNTRTFAESQFEYLIDFGDAMGLTPSQVTGLTTGNPNPGLETLMRLKGLGCSLDWATGSDVPMLLPERTVAGKSEGTGPEPGAEGGRLRDRVTGIAATFGGGAPAATSRGLELPDGPIPRAELFARGFSALSVDEIAYLIDALVAQLKMRAERRHVAKNLSKGVEE